MNNSVSVILALRERLKSAGYRLHLGHQIDPKTDQLPCVSIQIAPGGLKTISEKPVLKKTIELLIGYVFKTHTDPLIEVLEATEKLISDVIVIDKCHKVDTLNGTAIGVNLLRTAPILDEGTTDLGLVQLTLQITYLEK